MCVSITSNIFLSMVKRNSSVELCSFLNRSHLEKMVKAGQPVTRKNAEIRTVDDYRKSGMPRALTSEEVAEAFMKSISQVCALN